MQSVEHITKCTRVQNVTSERIAVTEERKHNTQHVQVSENQTSCHEGSRLQRILIRKLTALTAVMSLGAGSDSAMLSFWNK